MGRFFGYNVFRRKNSKGKFIYYVRFLNPETGEVLKTLSSGLGNQVAAIRWAEAMLEEVQEELLAPKDVPLLADYAVDYFTEGSVYETRKTERGYSVAKVYLYTCACYTRKRIIPMWGTYPLSELTSEIIDREIISLFRSGEVASDTVNRILRVLRLILDGAVTDGFISENPAARVKQVKVTKKVRGVYTKSELVSLFENPLIWHDFRHYTLNLLAFTTGMRLGEIRGLCLENVFPNYIAVRLQWENGYGLKPPKANSVRDIAIPPIASEALRYYIRQANPSRLVFYSLEDDRKPMTATHIVKYLYKTQQCIGISEAERKQRNLVFHSWRHTLNTVLRSGGIADAKIRQITGHRTEEMTTNYTHFQADDFRDVSSLTDRILVANVSSQS